MSMIYVVQGMTGEHEDRTTWSVGATFDKAEAEGLRDRLNLWCMAYGYWDEDDNRPMRPTKKPAEDPTFRCDYTGTSYSVEEIPMLGSATT